MQRDPASPRRPPMAQAYMPRGAPPPRPYYQGGAPDPRYRPHSPAQSYADPTSPTHYAESVVSEAESEQWPLPAARRMGQPHSRSHSPSSNSRRPKHRPSRDPRDHYQYPSNQSRHYQRARPPPGAYQRGPPRHQQGYGQWHGEGYNGPQPGYGPSYSHRPPPPRSGPPPTQSFPYAPQGVHHQSRSPRYPPDAPIKIDPAKYDREPQPVVTEDAYPNANWPLDLSGVNNSLLAPTAKDSARVKIPSYYFGDPDATEPENSVATSIDENHDSPMESQLGSVRAESRAEERNEPSPEPAAPIRQASLGKKTRPTLTTVTTGEKRKSSADADIDQPSVPQSQPDERDPLADFDGELDALPGAWISEGPTPDEHREHDQASEHGSDVALAPSASEAAVQDHHASDSKEKVSNPRGSSHLFTLPPIFADSGHSTTSGEFSFNFTDMHDSEDREVPLSPVTDAHPDEDTLEAPVSPIEPEDLLSPIEAHMDHSENRRTRPSDIDMEAIREAESRGSMTSLPDLIRRATTLRTNLDRGKTASRLGMNFFNNSDTDVDVEKYRANARKSGSISDMLTAFPSPGANSDTRKSWGNFSSMLRLSRIPSIDPAADNAEKKPRKYCGMPLWLCLVLLLLVVLLIAAAVVIPVVLIVIPKQHHTTTTTNKPAPTSTSHLTALQKCETNLECANGGINIVTQDDPCSCLCVDGYTGKTCTEKSSFGCTTMSISNSAVEATVGENVKDLIQSADQSFNIPLNAETILGLFSSADLTCSAEDQLVSFSLRVKKARSAAPSPHYLPTPTLDRQRRTVPNIDAAAASSSGSASSSTGSPRDFAGTAVLYIFQETGEHTSAMAAQERFQDFFSSRQSSGHGSRNSYNISLGNGFSCNLPEKRLVWVLANGTVVGN